MVLNYDIAVDLTPEFNKLLSPKFSVSLGDHGSREYMAKILQSGEPYEIAENSLVSIVGKKPDGHIFAYDCTYSDEYVYFTIEEQMTPVAGIVTCELIVEDELGNRLGSANFTFWVESCPVSDGDASDSDLQLFQEAIDAASDVQRILDSFGGPNVARTADEMINTSKVYVYIGSETGYTYGHWYYYDTATSTWTDGGIYQSDGVNTDTTLTASGVPADAKATGDALATKQDILTFDITPTEGSTNPVTSDGVYTVTDAIEKGLADTSDYVNLTSLREQINTPGNVYYANGQDNNTSSAIQAYSRSDFIRVAPGCIIRFSEVRQIDTACVVAFYDDAKTYVQSKSVPGTGRNHHNGSVEIDAFGYVRFGCRNVELANATFTIITKDGEEIAEVKEASVEEFNDLLSGAVWEIGSINTSGVDQASTVRVRCDYIPVNVSIVKFDITEGYRFAAVWYNEIKGFLRDDYWNANPVTLTPPEGTKYLRLVVSKVTEEEATVDYGNEVSADGVRFKTKPLYSLTNEVPDIWESYLDTKTPEIKTALLTLGDTGVAFTFVTDVHVAKNNMITPVIMKRLENICPVDYHINGGDYIWSEHTESAMVGIDDLCFWNESLGDLVEYPLRGNHDNNNYDGENPQNVISASQFYAIMTRRIENLVNTEGRTYYCIDNESQKVRLICLDTSLTSTAFTEEMAWMQAKLTEKDNTWTIMIIQHYLWGGTTAELHQVGQAVINAVNDVYANIQAAFVGILGGHTHVDYNSTEQVNGYLLIARDTNIVNGGTGTNTLSFDYVTLNTSARTINFKKIGRGNDLSLSY